MLGMFLNAKRYRGENVDLAAENGLYLSLGWAPTPETGR